MSALPAVEIRSDIQAPASAPHPGVISKTALPLTSPRRRFHRAGVLRSCQKSGMPREASKTVSLGAGGSRPLISRFCSFSTSGRDPHGAVRTPV